ncbi:MAG TPA: hypothetical protein ENF26_03015 [Methanomicrobia archaeon]|nr:hypothetical protein [Methanomicrobia archaeon]HEX59103.1 hypothetical protein [Methanomicrobia archaeon]
MSAEEGKVTFVASLDATGRLQVPLVVRRLLGVERKAAVVQVTMSVLRVEEKKEKRSGGEGESGGEGGRR